MNRVIVAGASGFLGKHVLLPLLSRNYEVHGVSLSVPQDVKADGLYWHRADLLDRCAAKALIESIQPQGLLHLAWETTHGAYWKSTANMEWAAASLYLLSDFASAGGRRIVFAGSSAEYHWESAAALDEFLSPLASNNLYGSCKNALRAVLETWASTTEVSWAWGRIFNIFGPYEKPQRLVPTVIRTLLAGKVLPFDDGLVFRDFLHVKDAGDAFAALFASEVQGPVNIASGMPTSIRDLVLMIANYLGATERVAFGAVPAQPGLPETVISEITRLRDEVGWQLPVSLEQRIRETCDWWREEKT